MEFMKIVDSLGGAVEKLQPTLPPRLVATTTAPKRREETSTLSDLCHQADAVALRAHRRRF